MGDHNAPGHKANGHKLLMLLCCLIPVAVIAYYLINGRSGQGFSWSYLMILLCPLMHIFMMKSHGHGSQDESCHSQEQKPANNGDTGKL